MNAIESAIRFHKLHSDWVGDGLRPVDKELAQHRADVCLTCPKHDSSRPIYEALAGTVANHVRQQIEYKNGLKLRVEGEKSLHICGACNCVLRLKVWANIEHIKKNTDLDDLDANCWIRSELK